MLGKCMQWELFMVVTTIPTFPCNYTILYHKLPYSQLVPNGETLSNFCFRLKWEEANSLCVNLRKNSQWYSTRYIQKRWVPVGERNRALSHYKDILLSMWISIIKIKWSCDHLIFIIGIPRLVRQLLYIEILSWQQQCRKTQRFVTIKWLYITVTSQEHLRCIKSRQRHSLINSKFKLTTQTISKLCITGSFVGNPPITAGSLDWKPKIINS